MRRGASAARGRENRNLVNGPATGRRSPAEEPASAHGPGRPAAGPQIRLSARDLPILDYEHLTVEEIAAQFSRLTRRQLLQIRDFEESHRRRRALLERLERQLAEMRAATS